MKEGHEVRLFIEAKDEREIADGFVPKTDDWVSDVPWADVIVFDDVLGQAAQRQAYNRIDNIMIPNMYYRKDIGDRWFEDFDRLHTWGYLRP